MWTSEVKQQILDRIEQAVLIDAIGSSEGSMGTQITMKGVPVETAKFAKMEETKVFTDDDREVEPGSDEVGMVAAGGNVPIGYYKDEAKSAKTFRVINGVRYSFPGDFAKVAADGSLILLGRGSQVINTGGEKVFPEEVEEAVKRVEGVRDCLVVGVENEKFGQAVTAVVSLEDGSAVDSDDHHRLGQERPRRLQGTQVGDLRRPRPPRPERQGRLPPRQGARRSLRHPLIPTREQMASSGRHLFTHSALTASGEQFFGEEVEDAFDAGVVALLGQHRVVALGAAGEFHRDERVAEQIAQRREPVTDEKSSV